MMFDYERLDGQVNVIVIAMDFGDTRTLPTFDEGWTRAGLAGLLDGARLGRDVTPDNHYADAVVEWNTGPILVAVISDTTSLQVTRGGGGQPGDGS